MAGRRGGDVQRASIGLCKRRALPGSEPLRACSQPAGADDDRQHARSGALSGISAAMAGMISALNAEPARSNFLPLIRREGQNG